MNQFSINNNYEEILYLIKKKAHGREISKSLNIPLTTIQRALKNLLKSNILDFDLIGKNKIFFIKNSLTAKKYVYNAVFNHDRRHNHYLFCS